MYEVQVKIPSEPFDPAKEADWSAHTVIEQLDTDEAELEEARRVREGLAPFYTFVRIIMWPPGGQVGQVVT
ncbi:hypothetical protein ACFW2V_13620 [Streptomyces sp. NPDC058947]|uniref:hypothetical protein n=1 Tax=Streptomyces sp. NPDC058947 TaxID=3346675 RepID=UPI00367DB1A0